MADRSVPPSLWWRLSVLGASHLGMLGLMHVFLEAFEPDPSGFRFDAWDKFAGFAGLTAGPVVVGLAAWSRRGTILAALIQLTSPLLLVNNMRDSKADLNLAILLWWFPIPIVVALVIWIEQRGTTQWTT